MGKADFFGNEIGKVYFVGEVAVKRRTLLCMIVMLSATGFALAQRGGGRIGRGGGRGGVLPNGNAQQREEQALRMFDVFLLLDGTQKPQVKMIFDNAIQEARDSQSSQAEASETELFDAAKAQAADNELQKLADQEAAALSRELVLEAKTLSRVMAILHDDQKAKVDLFLYTQIESFLTAAAGIPPR